MGSEKTSKPSEVFGVKVWFISDTHFGHKNILKHCPKRAEEGGFANGDVEAHDKWLTDVWNRTIGKKDIVYIVGDFSFNSPDFIRKKLMPSLHGRKYLILGNHDKSSSHLEGYFEKITQMDEVVFKKKNFPFIDEPSFRVFMCHYPMVTWPDKHHGSVNVHGHCHSNLDQYNDDNTSLRVDVGIDGELAGFRPVSLERLYAHFKAKAGGMPLDRYAEITKSARSGDKISDIVSYRPSRIEMFLSKVVPRLIPFIGPRTRMRIADYFRNGYRRRLNSDLSRILDGKYADTYIGGTSDEWDENEYTWKVDINKLKQEQ